MKTRHRSGLPNQRFRPDYTERDKRLLKAYKKLLSELPATGSPSDNKARHLIALEIRKVQRRLHKEGGIKASDLKHLEAIAEEELDRNKRLLNAPKRNKT